MQANLIIIGQCKMYGQKTLILFWIINYFKYLKLNDSAVLQVKIYFLARYSNAFDRCSNKSIHNNGKPQTRTQFITYESQQCKYENYN